MYCVYLTIYSGNKLPPFYIGFSTVKNIANGYKGSVSSQLYKTIWKSEITNNPQMFRTKILKTFSNKKDANKRETELLQKLNVVRNPLYINKHDGLNFYREGPCSEGHKKRISETRKSTPRCREAAKEQLDKINNRIKEIGWHEYYGEEYVERKKKENSKRFKEYWNDPEMRARMSKKPEDTTKIKKAALNSWQNEEIRNRRVEACKRYWANPENRAKRCKK